jgi:ribonuclease G
MRKEIIINSAMNEVRIAITEDAKLAELFIESAENERSVGNIYLGRVNKVIQGINAAFIDIGLNQDAFLHFSDVDETLENLYTDDDDDTENEPELENENPDDLSGFSNLKPANKISADVALRKVKAVQKTNVDAHHATFKTKKMGNVQINLEPNQNVIVQIVREAYGSKGVRVTTKIGLPGRYVVLLPFDNVIGISKKINSLPERKRLRFLAKNNLPKGIGCIIRTASSGKSEDELLKDYKDLLEKWQEIERKVKKATRPGLVHQDMELATSVVRDLFTTDVHRVAIDSKKLYKEITSYLRWAAPRLVDKVEFYNGSGSIFEYFGVEKELDQTYQRKVFLAGGGSIVIDQTEAMFIIDINSGRAIQEQQQEQNAFNTNIEALKEIARQIRLRDMSGMVLIDFIDMANETHRRKIYTEMRKELSRDRAKTVVYPLTQLSIMQITRQRINQYITEKITEICPTCEGRGRVASKAVLVNAIERWLKNFRAVSREFRVILMIHPAIANYLTEGTLTRLSRLMIKYFIKIKIQQNDHLSIDQFKFISVKTQKDITQEFSYKQ